MLKLHVLGTSNCLRVQAFAELHGSRDLAAAAEDYRDDHATEIVQSKEFLELPGDQVCKLFTRDSLDLEEEDRHNSALNWINHDLP